MSRLYVAVAAAGGALSLASSAQGVVVANYSDFQPGSPAPSGWAFYWNPVDPIDLPSPAGSPPLTPGPLNPSSFEPLVYNPTGEIYLPTTAGGNNLRATPTTLIPGPGVNPPNENDPPLTPRYVIAAYTFSADDFVEAGLNPAGTGTASMNTYSFLVADTSEDGIEPRVYYNEQLYFGGFPLPANYPFDQNSPGAYAPEFPNVSVGDTIYVAIGSNGNDTGDVLTLDFSLDLVPEPTSAGLLALVGAAATLTRRRAR